ncbi:hypothetical protein E3N88_14464 [Mikania micrantha]|uniref:OTU domain-containing protein n=1 Tax=Mikania micrantha TaxID=192012 RepID=A0A5N6P1I5_9ASTR|nr:hypothetical protein E3N88_14464 [Mikania micrantha]
MSNQQRPALQRSRSTSSRGKKRLETSQVDSVVASPVKPEGMNNLRRFGGYIPSMLHCYVSNIQDVMPDGNCGFRSVAVGLGFNENQWGFVRQQLLQEVDTNREAYRYVFNSVDSNLYEAVRHSINWFDIRPAPEEHWMLMPYTGLVVAQRFGMIVHLISQEGCITFFPLWLAPSTIPQHNVVCLLHMPMHFVNIRFGACRYGGLSSYSFRSTDGAGHAYRADILTARASIFARQGGHLAAGPNDLHYRDEDPMPQFPPPPPPPPPHG